MCSNLHKSYFSLWEYLTNIPFNQSFANEIPEHYNQTLTPPEQCNQTVTESKLLSLTKSLFPHLQKW